MVDKTIRSASRRRASSAGFTMMELLVVMIILGVLAAIALPLYLRARDQAREARATSEVNQLGKLLRSAQIPTGVGGYDNYPACSTPFGRSLRNLPASDPCWTGYQALLDEIEARSGESMAGYRAGDPWKSPYVFDKNEGEVVGGNCLRQDSIRSAGVNASVDSLGTGDDVVIRLTRMKMEPDC